MAQSDAAFTGAIPEIYDRFLGPLLFEPFARELAGRFRGFSGALLETAAGTGRLTRALAEAADSAARILATDLNEAMLEQAARLVSAPNVEWRQADAQDLPVADAAFDAVACQFGVMFFPDKAAAFAEARRVLRPGGRFVFNVWDGLESNVPSKVVLETLVERFPDDPPEFLARVPFGYHDLGRIRADLAAAGFAEIAVETVALEVRAGSARDVAQGLCLGSPLRSELEARAPERLDAVVEAVTQALEQAYGRGPFAGEAQALVVTARA